MIVENSKILQIFALILISSFFFGNDEAKVDVSNTRNIEAPEGVVLYAVSTHSKNRAIRPLSAYHNLRGFSVLTNS